MYFDVLIRKSFFDKVDKVSSDETYKMHDLLHELAQFVSIQECFRFVGDEMSQFLKIPKTIRHLSIETGNPEVLKSVGRFKNLQTLQITDEYDSNLIGVLVEIFQVIGSIRLLHLKYSFELKGIPEEIRYLQHLRYLRFSSFNVELLPRSISTLYHLQFLIVDDCFQMSNLSDNYFPRDMNNLLNLRYLSYWNLNFTGIGKLMFLTKLCFNIKNENGYRIGELELMNELRYLYLCYLENVRDDKDACKAKLCDKRKLTDLSLQWKPAEVRDNPDRHLDERVFDNLQPHNYIETLQIEAYMGARSAIWMNEVHTINNLEKVYLHNCLNWETLPPFGQLPFLKTLSLWNMPKLRRIENKFHRNDICCVFPSLQNLYLQDMKSLVDWFDASIVDDLFPCLTDLFLFRCPNLQELPYLPPKLESLNIHKIGWKTLNLCCSISKSISLKSLQVDDCPNITSISFEGEIVMLEKLILKDLQALQSLPSLTNSISSLELIDLSELPLLQEYPDIPLPLPFRKWKNEKAKLQMSFIINNNEKYLGFEKLEHMNEIRFLNIYDLKYVRDPDEACKANLSDKRKLIDLCLNWAKTNYSFEKADRDIADRDLDERMLDNLQPHNYLKTLKIYNYMGARSALWMNEAQAINNLQTIRLRNCMEWEILPPFGQLPFLRSLNLENMPKVKRLENKFHGNDMCSPFPSLQTLWLDNMELLVDWFDASIVDGLFPCLTTLSLRHCPNLQELPYLPPKLESLHIKNIGWKTLNCSKFIPLETLEVCDCPNITSISLEVEIGKLICLIIKDLPSLQSFPSSLANISSLVYLELAKLPQLHEYPDPPLSLKELHYS